MAPRSIAHIITSLATGGAEMMLVRLLAGTDQSRWRPSVISLRDRGTLSDQIEQMGIPVMAIGVRGKLPDPMAVWRLRRVVRAQAPLVIHGWMYHGNVAALVGRVLAAGRPPVVWSIRSTVYNFRSDGRVTAGVARLGARLSGGAARIVYNSRAGARQHEALGYSAERGVVIPNGFDTARYAPSPAARSAFRRRLGITDRAVLVGRIGRYHPMKDYPGFLEAAATLLKDHPDVRFVLAGADVDSRNAELDRWVARLGIGHAVHLLGEVPDTHNLWPALDIACSSSSYAEAFPTVLGEAMACEVPCVTTDVGDSAWIVGEAGRVVPPADPAALAAALRALIDAGPEARHQMGVRGRARVIRDFSLARVVSEYESLYEDVLQSHTGR